jgi:hypothetical protein
MTSAEIAKHYARYQNDNTLGAIWEDFAHYMHHHLNKPFSTRRDEETIGILLMQEYDIPPVIRDVRIFFITHPDITTMSFLQKLFYVVSGQMFRELTDLRILVTKLEYEIIKGQ